MKRSVKVTVALIFVWLSSTAIGASLPRFDALRLDYRASDIRVLDSQGRLLQRMRADFEGRRGDWLGLDDVSPALIGAVIASEDRRFYAHNGVDLQAVAAAGWNRFVGSAQRGASTLTMQLAGLLDARHRRPAGGRGLIAKLNQALYAQALERRWSKQQILEAYLNLAPFRGELVGVDALSQVLFQKHASGLDAQEAALAAAMLRGPNVSAELLAKRACVLLVETRGEADCRDLKMFVDTKLRNGAVARVDRSELASHFARWVVTQDPPAPGAAVSTTISGALQHRVLAIVDRRLQALSGSNVRDAAVVVLENDSGAVLAYLGSSGKRSQAPWVDHAKALRQAGSTLKPFLYQQAIEQQRLTAVSLLDDGPLNLPTGNGLYVPRNYDERFSGWVSVRVALASSLNIPAVRALTMVDPGAFRDRLVSLGLPLEQRGDYYGYSLALGSADVSLLTLTNAYRALANLGKYSPIRLRPASDDSSVASAVQPVMQEAASWIVGDILSDTHARARTFGLDGPLTTPFWTAVKTGTSKDMRDNWTLGWSSRYTVGVWVGNSGGDAMREVSGVSGAGPIWHDIMTYLHGQAGSEPPPRPGNVHRAEVSFADALEPPRIDYFVGDTTLTHVKRVDAMGSAPTTARIVSPTDGAILALDPDIPPANQRVVFRAAASGPVAWRITGEDVVWSGEMLWMPRPGRHQIELLGEQGEVLDSLTLTVRGAAAVAAD